MTGRALNKTWDLQVTCYIDNEYYMSQDNWHEVGLEILQSNILGGKSL
jgi:hypothetical protein